MKKAKEPNAGLGIAPLEESEENNLQRYKVTYNNTRLDGKFYNEGDEVETTQELSNNYFTKI